MSPSRLTYLHLNCLHLLGLHNAVPVITTYHCRKHYLLQRCMTDDVSRKSVKPNTCHMRCICKNNTHTHTHIQWSQNKYPYCKTRYNMYYSDIIVSACYYQLLLERLCQIKSWKMSISLNWATSALAHHTITTWHTFFRVTLFLKCFTTKEV